MINLETMVEFKNGEAYRGWKDDSWMYQENETWFIFPSTRAVEEALEKSMA